MKRMPAIYKNISCIAAVAAMVLLGASPVGAQVTEKSFEVRFDKPLKAGQTYTVTTTDAARASQTTATPDGQTTTASNFRRTVLEAEVRIEKLDDKSLPAQLVIAIKRLTVQSVAAGQEDGESNPNNILPAGTIVSATFVDGEPTFTLAGGKPVPADARTALRREFHRTQLTDAVFGTPEKKKIGDSWPVNTKAMKVDITDPQALDPRGFSGDVTLKSRRSVTGVDCLQLEAVLRSKEIPSLPIEPAEASVTVTYNVSLPVDPEKPIVAHTMKTVTHVVIEQKPLGKGVVRTTSDSEMTHDATWIAK